jgi:hypothetical protein
MPTVRFSMVGAMVQHAQKPNDFSYAGTATVRLSIILKTVRLTKSDQH